MYELIVQYYCTQLNKYLKLSFTDYIDFVLVGEWISNITALNFVCFRIETHISGSENKICNVRGPPGFNFYFETVRTMFYGPGIYTEYMYTRPNFLATQC